MEKFECNGECAAHSYKKLVECFKKHFIYFLKRRQFNDHIESIKKLHSISDILKIFVNKKASYINYLFEIKLIENFLIEYNHQEHLAGELSNLYNFTDLHYFSLT